MSSPKDSFSCWIFKWKVSLPELLNVAIAQMMQWCNYWADTQQTFVGLKVVFKTCLEDVFNTSSVYQTFVFQDVLKTSWKNLTRRLEDILMTYWRHLGLRKLPIFYFSDMWKFCDLLLHKWRILTNFSVLPFFDY